MVANELLKGNPVPSALYTRPSSSRNVTWSLAAFPSGSNDLFIFISLR